MNTPQPEPEPAPDAAPSRAARRLLELERLAAIGMDLATLVQQLAHRAAVAAAEAPEPTKDAIPAPHILTYDRLARAIRRTYALEAKLEEMLRTERRRDDAAQGASTGRATRLALKGRRAEVVRLVEDSIEADRDIEDKSDALFDLNLYLERQHVDFSDPDKALGHIASDICEAIGVSPDIKNWSDQIIGYVYVPKPQPPGASSPDAFIEGPFTPPPRERPDSS